MDLILSSTLRSTETITQQLPHQLKYKPATCRYSLYLWLVSRLHFIIISPALASLASPSFHYCLVLASLASPSLWWMSHGSALLLSLCLQLVIKTMALCMGVCGGAFYCWWIFTLPQKGGKRVLCFFGMFACLFVKNITVKLPPAQFIPNLQKTWPPVRSPA